MRDLLKVREIAELLGFSPPTVYYKLREGSIPGLVRVGQSIRVQRQTFEAWLQRMGSETNGNDDGKDNDASVEERKCLE